MFTFPFINNTAAFGGELKNIKKSALYGTVFAVLASGALLMIFLQMYYSYLGFEFAMQAPMSWPSALSNAGVTPNMLTIATIASSNNSALIWMMNIFFAFWYLASVQQTILADSRYILAMSFDGILPRRLAGVSDRFHTPIKTLVLGAIVMLVWVVATILPQAASFASYFGVAQGFLLVVTFIVVGLGAMLLPYIRKDLYESACPKVLRRNFIGVPMISLLGLIVFIYNLQNAYFLMIFPQYYGITPQFLGTLVGAGIFAVVAYVVAKAYRKKEGIDISFLFKQLPPE